jgi:hypothetical protein
MFFPTRQDSRTATFYLVTSISMILPTTTIDLYPSPLRSLPKNLPTYLSIYLSISHFSLSENKNGLNHNWFLSRPLLPPPPPPHQNRKLDLGFPQHKPFAMDFASENSSHNCELKKLKGIGTRKAPGGYAVVVVGEAAAATAQERARAGRRAAIAISFPSSFSFSLLPSGAKFSAPFTQHQTRHALLLGHVPIHSLLLAENNISSLSDK